MKTELFKYNYVCTNCGMHFTVEYKDESIDVVNCPMPDCGQKNIVPNEINRILNSNKIEELS